MAEKNETKDSKEQSEGKLMSNGLRFWNWRMATHEFFSISSAFFEFNGFDFNGLDQGTPSWALETLRVKKENSEEPTEYKVYYKAEYEEDLYSIGSNGNFTSVKKEYGERVEDNNEKHYPYEHKDIFYRPSYYKSSLNLLATTHGSYSNNGASRSYLPNLPGAHNFGDWILKEVIEDDNLVTITCTRESNLGYANYYMDQEELNHFSIAKKTEKIDGVDTEVELIHKKSGLHYKTGYYGRKLYNWALTGGNSPSIAAAGVFKNTYIIQPTDKMKLNMQMTFGVPQFTVNDQGSIKKSGLIVKMLNKYIDNRHGYRRINGFTSRQEFGFLAGWPATCICFNRAPTKGLKNNCLNIINDITTDFIRNDGNFITTMNPTVYGAGNDFANIAFLKKFIEDKPEYIQKIDKLQTIPAFKGYFVNIDCKSIAADFNRNATWYAAALYNIAINTFLNEDWSFYDKANYVDNEGNNISIAEYKELFCDYIRNYHWVARGQVLRTKYRYGTTNYYNSNKAFAEIREGVWKYSIADPKGEIFGFPMAWYIGDFPHAQNYDGRISLIYDTEVDETSRYIHEFWKFRDWKDLKDKSYTYVSSDFKIIRNFLFGAVNNYYSPMVFEFERKNYDPLNINIKDSKLCITIYKYNGMESINVLPNDWVDENKIVKKYKRYFHPFRADYGVSFSFSDGTTAGIEKITYIDNNNNNYFSVWERNENGNFVCVADKPIEAEELTATEDIYGNKGVYLSLSLYNCDETTPQYYNVNDGTYLGVRCYIDIANRGIKSIYSRLPCTFIATDINGQETTIQSIISIRSGNPDTEYIYIFPENYNWPPHLFFKYSIYSESNFRSGGAGFSNFEAPADYGTFRFSSDDCPSGYIDILINNDVNNNVNDNGNENRNIYADINNPQYPIIYDKFSVDISYGVYVTAKNPDSKDEFGNGYTNEHYAKSPVYGD